MPSYICSKGEILTHITERRADVFIYEVDMPTKIHGMTVPCSEGYTVYLNSRLSEIQRLKAYKHELEHIDNGDYDKINTGLIERYAHGEE